MKQSYLLFTIITLFIFSSCNNTGKSNDSGNETTVESCCKNAVDTISYTGTVLDGAMNSIFIITDKNDTLSFGYPMLDRAKIQSYMINDTVTVNTQADTVISIINKSKH